MAENSAISWTTHSFNHVRGCTKVSPGCKFCYAEQFSGRNHATLGQWGPNGTRVVASESMWKQPLKWNRDAEKAGERHRVFCASLADVFEGRDTMPESAWEAVDAARNRLFALIEQTPHLDWLLLTKRPENIMEMVPPIWKMNGDLRFRNKDGEWYSAAKGGFPPNVWIGTSVENQETANERIPHLLQVPAKVRFLSMEPLLGFVSLTKDYRYPQGFTGQRVNNVVSGLREIEWVILGGESGPNRREMDMIAARTIIEQCKVFQTPIWVKQDNGLHPGNQGRFTDAEFALKQLPINT